MESTLGQYKIVREAGKGGMGIIYKAMNPKTQRSVAIKILPPMMVDRVTVERFHREVQAMTKLKHPNMIEVYDSGMEKGKHFLVMEFVEGENVKALIKRKGALPVKECLRVGTQVGDALAHMHQQGMIHRDIKPANIMITPEGKIKLMDYGLVKILGVTSVTVDGTSLGTAEYMSPEQITGEGVDSRTDIYSFGITMYEMLTGRLPFVADSLQSLLIKHKTETPPSLRSLRAEIPLEVELIVNKAMAKEIPARYQTFDELLRDLYKLTGAPQGKSRDFSATVVNVKKESTERPVKESVKPIADRKLSAPAVHEPSGFPVAAIFIFIVALVAGGYFFRSQIFSFAKKVHLPPIGGRTQGGDLLSEARSSLQDLEQAENHFMEGQNDARHGMPDKAIAEYQAAIQLREDFPLYYKELALLYEERNEHKKAIKIWQRFLKYSQDSDETKMAQEHILILRTKE